MHVRKMIAILVGYIFVLSSNLMAKDSKPTMLVYGDNVEAFAAAVQSSRSNVPTVWVIPASTFTNEFLRNELSITANDGLDAGIWLDVLRKVAKAPLSSDSLVQARKRQLNPQDLRDAFSHLVQQEKNLKVVYNAKINKLEQGKKDWTLTLSTKEKYTVRSVVDATADAQLKLMLKGDEAYLKPSKIATVQQLSVPLRRTLVAIAEHGNQVWGYTLMDMLSRNRNNLFFISTLIQVDADEQSVPLRMQVGQALGAIAGYCAFFKTSADKIDVRKLQSELITFDTRLLPFRNISTFAPNFAALQRVFLTGVYTEDKDLQALVYDKDATVQVDNIQATFNQLYSRSQLWFKTTNKDVLDLQDVLALLKNVAFRGDEIDELIAKEWNTKLKFDRPFDKNKLEKYEFEVLFDKYAQPFVKTVNQSGDIIR